MADNFCFFFPYNEDSGVPVVFYRMANAIAQSHPEIQVLVIDYPDGAMARHLLDLPNLKVYGFQDGQTIVPPEDAVLITQSLVPYHWPVELKPQPKTRMFFWNLHPQNFVPSLLPLFNLRDVTINNYKLHQFLSIFFPETLKKVRGYVGMLIKHQALSFMDQTNLDSTKKYLFIPEINAPFLPVPATSVTKLKVKFPDKGSQHFNYCWVGRLCDFKVHILIYTAKKLADIAQQLNIQITYYIVGDGPLKAYVEEQTFENDNFKIVFCGAIAHEKLDDFLTEKIDAVTAMGTSALEGAKLGIPTILLDASYKPVNEGYKFRFLYQAINYDLAHFITKADYLQNNHSLEDIVSSIKDNYEEESRKSLQYFIEKHSIERVVREFLDQAGKTTLEFGMIEKGFFEKPKLLKILNFFRSK